MTHKTIAPVDSDPYLGWTPDTIAQWFADHPLQTGDSVIIADPQAGVYQFRLAAVANPSSGRQKRIVLSHAAEWGGLSFYRNGKNCFHPKGQSRLLPPDPRLLPHFQAPGDTVTFSGLYGRG